MTYFEIRFAEVEKHRTYDREIDSRLCVSCGWRAFSHSLDPERTVGPQCNASVIRDNLVATIRGPSRR